MNALVGRTRACKSALGEPVAPGRVAHGRAAECTSTYVPSPDAHMFLYVRTTGRPTDRS